MKTFYIRTLGCKVNQCDSQELRERLFQFGLNEYRKGEEADISIINTCCVTHRADRKSRAAIRDLVRRRGLKSSLIAVTGCYVRYDRQAIESIEGVDAVFENSRKDEFIIKWIGKESLNGQTKNFRVSGFAGRTRAFLKIQDGCDNRCSFCIVPYVRGPSRSKGISCIMEEAHRRVEAGYKEIVLTGVNLGSFGKDLRQKIDLVHIIEELEQIKNLLRIRLSSIEATDVTDQLIEKMAHSEKLCPHLHIPFQSGDDEILRLMNKRLRTKDYLEIIEKARTKIKNLAITCDFIVGFPAEEDESFQNSLEFVKSVLPLRTHIFTYSQRQGTSLCGKEKEVYICEDIVKDRFDRLKSLSDELSLDFKNRYLSKELSVLFEEKKGGLWQGYSENYIKISVRSDLPLRNVISKVKVVDFKGDSCLAEIIQK